MLQTSCASFVVAVTKKEARARKSFSALPVIQLCNEVDVDVGNRIFLRNL